MRATSIGIGALALAVAAWAGCRNDDPGPVPCDPDDPDACADDQRCIPDGDGGFCEAVASCDPEDPASCPAGYVCRPSDGGPVCEPTQTAGRIPSCIDSEGIDVFAVEANGALSVTWNVNVAIDHSGGFRVRWGVESEMYDGSVEVGPEVREVVISPLDNGTPYFVAVEALGGDGAVAHTSCELDALPHVLEFQPDVRVNEDTGGTQQTPALASNLEGTRLFLVWDDDGSIVMAESIDFGDTWSSSIAIGSGTLPAVTVQDEILDDEGEVVTPEGVLVAYEQGGRVMLVGYDPAAGTVGEPLDVAAGRRPHVAVGPSAIHLVFEEGDGIHHAGSTDAGATFSDAEAVHGSTTMAHAPRVAVNGFTDEVYVAWDAIDGAGDSNIYFAASPDAGGSFGGPVRVDDDSMGQNQLNVSIAVDARSQKIYATWEDRRGGANVYFTWSEDGGASWEPNVDVGAGLGGDQFRPEAVLDAARNVYVAFHDTSDGMRVVFSRFNAEGTFDPPLLPSREAGRAGVVADEPTVASDRYGAVYVAWQENRNASDVDIFFARAE